MRDDVLPCLLPSFQGLCWCALVLLCIVQSVQPCSAGSAQYVLLCDPGWHFGRPACRPQLIQGHRAQAGSRRRLLPPPRPAPACHVSTLTLTFTPATASLDCKHFCQNRNMTANSRPVIAGPEQLRFADYTAAVTAWRSSCRRRPPLTGAACKARRGEGQVKKIVTTHPHYFHPLPTYASNISH